MGTPSQRLFGYIAHNCENDSFNTSHIARMSEEKAYIQASQII